MRRLPRTRAVVAIAATAAILAGARPVAGQALAPVAYRPPVAAPVVDPFRPPTTPFGPGNRGLEHATTPGTRVVAAAGGRVTFAGQVGGDLYVTVQHADGIRTTYAFLAALATRAGAIVEAGELVGEAGARMLWTARLGDAYLDPAVLLAASGAGTVRLVPNRPSAGSSRGRVPLVAPAVSAAAAEWALGAGP